MKMKHIKRKYKKLQLAYRTVSDKAQTETVTETQKIIKRQRANLLDAMSQTTR